MTDEYVLNVDSVQRVGSCCEAVAAAPSHTFLPWFKDKTESPVVEGS